jgi:hypothetical protein
MVFDDQIYEYGVHRVNKWIHYFKINFHITNHAIMATTIPMTPTMISVFAPRFLPMAFATSPCYLKSSTKVPALSLGFLTSLIKPSCSDI